MLAYKKIFLTFAVMLLFFSSPLLAKEVLVSDNFDDAEFENYEQENNVEIYDPLEKYNRKIFIFNDILDRYFLEHVAKTYRNQVPQRARKIVRNFLTNLSSPISAMNSFLQGKTDNGLATMSNFLINTTVGIGGLFDVASEKGIHYKSEDFGKTLGHYGMGSGAYLMLPILGPSSTRDFSGLALDKSISPFGFNTFNIGGETDFISGDIRIGIAIVSGIDMRESLLDIIDDIRADSFDPYATVRSAYLQKRFFEIKQNNSL